MIHHAMPMTDTVPAELVQAILRERLADPSVRLADLEAAPMPGDGFSGNLLTRVRLAWTTAGGSAGPRSATWVVKRWLPGGHARRLLGVDRPLEALGWLGGLLRPAALPAGVSTPIVGARLDPGGRAAWIVMEDVSAALGRYSRAARLRPSEAVARAARVLDGLARLHARWERPERRAMLAACPWLVPMERFLWCEAASCAAVLGRALPRGPAAGSAVTDEFRADVEAFLAWLPAGDRRLFAQLLCRRDALAGALRPFPRTLLHGDVDDRNVGLRAARARSTAAAEPLDSDALVLIDWEWMGLGPPALDVARIWGTFPAVCDPSQPPPEATFSDELPDYYFDRYRVHGGILVDRRAWRRSCVLALLAHAMGQVSFIGSMVRHDVKPVVATLARQLEIVAPVARSLLAA